jgi:hypothetical protein
MKRSGGYNIDNLNIQLPDGFELRANAIARETARQLSFLPLNESVNIATLNLPALNITGGESNHVIARQIAQSIHHQVNNTVRKGGNHAG